MNCGRGDAPRIDRPNIACDHTDLGYGDLSHGRTHAHPAPRRPRRLRDPLHRLTPTARSAWLACVTHHRPIPDHAGVNGVLRSDRSSEGLPDPVTNTIAHALGEEGYRTALRQVA